ncbi:hypothetical protein COHA_001388 [Chlorella ohadii]|uniref:Uncharacterized protein n=1 Tax=Chlorella ohadii TaxID=2649997 RepID=A0AAD5DWN7_9CHLO|nr:hypothetical protein COHA_001388 [Chlorella ohadii]
MSKCQIDTLMLPSTSNILIGGKGSATIVGIPSGSGSGGCTDPGGQCMGWCQGLCCLTTGCMYASIYNKKSTTDYGVYTETTYNYYCKLFTNTPPPSIVGSSNNAVCTMGPNAKASCPSLAQSTLGINSTTYNFLVYNANNSVCQMPPSTASAGRKLHGLPQKVGPFMSAADIQAATTNLRVNKDMIRAALKLPAYRVALCYNAWQMRLHYRCPAHYPK